MFSETMGARARVCQAAITSMTNKTTLVMNYTAEELTFPTIIVRHIYQAASQQLLDSWQNKRMTGFKLKWFITEPEDAPSTAQGTDSSLAYSSKTTSAPIQITFTNIQDETSGELEKNPCIFSIDTLRNTL